jgi:hypothetical protein
MAAAWKPNGWNAVQASPGLRDTLRQSASEVSHCGWEPANDNYNAHEVAALEQGETPVDPNGSLGFLFVGALARRGV